MKIYSMLCLLIFTVAVNAQTQNRAAALAEVVAAENAFADRAAESGTRTAFLEFAADNGVVFNLKPENAKEVWQKRAVNNSLLAWRPMWVDVSTAGDLGYTTGTWAFSPTKSDAPVSWGEYFTIWKKQTDGSWKFLLDLGIQHGKAVVNTNSWKSPEFKKAKSKDKKDLPDVWQTLEKSFGESLHKKGAKKTYEKFASEQICLLRDGIMPSQDKSSALAQITDAQIATTVLGGEASGDMAYAYGEYELRTSDGKMQKGFYTRVWKREPKGWRIGAEVNYLLPQKQN